jgi:hypothetical protein
MLGRREEATGESSALAIFNRIKQGAEAGVVARSGETKTRDATSQTRDENFVHVLGRAAS